MQRLFGLAGWPAPLLPGYLAAMGAAAGGIEPDFAAEAGLSVTLAGCVFEPAAGAREVLQVYRARGLTAALRLLNGDFALAIVDEQTGLTHLARDRFGVRPLYYWMSDRKLAFASRIRSLLSLPEVPRDINREFAGLFAGSHYRYFDNDPHASPFAAVRQLPAAHALTWNGERAWLSRYWTLEAEDDSDLPEAKLAADYRELLLDAVKIRLQRTKRPAFALSGGMDSSSVLACAVGTTGKPQHAFSTVYADPTFDESSDIKTMLDATVERWHPVQVNEPDVHDLVGKMVQAHDEPVATATWLAHYVMCDAVAKNGFDAVFGGLGGDELNAGEYEHYLYFFADLKLRGMHERLAVEVNRWAHYHDHPIYRKDRDVMEQALRRMVDSRIAGVCLADRSRIERYAEAVEPEFFDVRRFLPAMEHPFSSYLKNRTWQDLSRETIPCCLRAEDRQAAAFGLVNVCPFFDHRLVELMFRVSPLLKYKDGVSKSLLRLAMKGLLPESTRTRVKKTGWNAPAHAWFAGRGGERLQDLIGSRRFRERGIYRVDAVRRLLLEHDRIVTGGLQQENHMMFLWQLVNLNAWLDWVDDLPPPGAAERRTAPARAR